MEGMMIRASLLALGIATLGIACTSTTPGRGQCTAIGQGRFTPTCQLPAGDPVRDNLRAWYGGGVNPTPEWGVVSRLGVTSCLNRVTAAEPVGATTCTNGGTPVSMTIDARAIPGYACGWFVLPTQQQCDALAAGCAELTGAGCWVAAETR